MIPDERPFCADIFFLLATATAGAPERYVQKRQIACK